MVPLWRWPELCQAVGAPQRQGPDVTGLCIDSRRIRAGDLFLALTGDPGPRFHASSRSNRDGHDFVADALNRGAVGALVHQDMDLNGTLLRVNDTLDSLWALARARRNALRGEVVAVTGSSGKTTAKNLLGAALKAFTTEGSLNNHLGVPLSLAATPAGTNTAVYEIGTNHPGEIEMLSKLVRPNAAALVLNVHPAHVEFFSDLDALRKEKLSIYNGLEKDSNLVVEQSIAQEGLPDSLRVWTFGLGEGAHCRLLRCEGRAAHYQLGGRRFHARVPGGGLHRATTLAAVFCLLDVLGRGIEDACNLGDELVPGGRGNLLQCGSLTLVDDSYNANPASMAAALANLRNPSGRSVAVLGEMLELGADSVRQHEALAAACAHIDLVVGVGKGMRPLMSKLPKRLKGLWREQADEELLQWLLAKLKQGDLVLVKGSNRVFWANGFTAKLASALR